MFFRIIIFFNLFLLLCQPIQAGNIKEYNKDVEHWIEIVSPQRREVTPDFIIWSSAANLSKHEWVVFREGKNVKVTLKDKNYKSHKVKPPFPLDSKSKGLWDVNAFIPTDDGWLMSYNRGEFGAALWWFSKNGVKAVKILEHHINQFIELNDKIYAIEGLSHGGLSNGSIIRVVSR